MKRSYKFFSILLLFVLLASCAPVTPAPTAAPRLHLQRFLKAPTGFAGGTIRSSTKSSSAPSATGCDGIGDFNGITEKLDYLQDLGVKGLWLMPINPPPPTMAMMSRLLRGQLRLRDHGGLQAPDRRGSQRDIKVIIDLVLNHSSSQHPWFESALTPAVKIMTRYVWSETDPGYQGPWARRPGIAPAMDNIITPSFGPDARPQLRFACRTGEAERSLPSGCRMWD